MDDGAHQVWVPDGGGGLMINLYVYFSTVIFLFLALIWTTSGGSTLNWVFRIIMTGMAIVGCFVSAHFIGWITL